MVLFCRYQSVIIYRTYIFLWCFLLKFYLKYLTPPLSGLFCKTDRLSTEKRSTGPFNIYLLFSNPTRTIHKIEINSSAIQSTWNWYKTSLCHYFLYKTDCKICFLSKARNTSPNKLSLSSQAINLMQNKIFQFIHFWHFHNYDTKLKHLHNNEWNITLQLKCLIENKDIYSLENHST